MNLHSENINEIAAALAKAQGEMTCALKDGNNPHFKSKYATLASVWDACRAPLSKHGLCVVQTTSSENDQLVMVTTLMHTSGQWIKSVMPVISGKSTPQAIGSATTYVRRYSLAAMVGVAPDDDDANEAQEQNVELKHQPQPIKFVAQNHEKAKPAVISKQQADELASILRDCDDEFKEMIKNYLKVEFKGSINEIPVSVYPKILADAIAKKNLFAPILQERKKLEGISNEPQ